MAFDEYTAKECLKEGCQVMAIGERVTTKYVAERMLKEFLEIK